MKYFSISTIKNWIFIRKIVFFVGGLTMFLLGCVLYGVILNLRVKSLSEEMNNKGITKFGEAKIEIIRSKYELYLYSDTTLVKTYKAVFGRNSQPKSANHDKATPIGEYTICSIDTLNQYNKFLRINYPNLNDAADGLRKGVISQKEYDRIRFEFYYGTCVNSKTALGGGIGVHGIGKLNFIFKNLPFVYNWTDGSIAVSDESINEIYSVVKIGTKVSIKR